VVEFALLSPILCLLLIGLFEFGRVLMVEQVITNAAREAAREACLLSTTEDAVEEAALRLTDAASLEDVEVAISPAINTLEGGDEVSVTVTVPMQAVSWISGNWFPSGYELSAVSVMRKEGFE
jgi:Flp pilus assembly protein TadG